MSALALILAGKGYSVSGSDEKNSPNLQNLISKGITIFQTQNALNISTICSNQKLKPLIIISTAIPKSNPELRAAKNAALKILHRSDLLALLIKDQPSIVISGTHGKTTTSTFATTLLALTNQDPTAIVGGLIPIYSSNAYAGNGKLLIAEADESDGTITKFKSNIAVITNIDLDHTNHYKNINSLVRTMKKFANNSDKVLANYDCKTLRNYFQSSIWWSTKTIKGVEFAAIPYSITGKQTSASFYEKEKLIGEINMPIPGLHNLSNLTGAIAACRLAGISFKQLNQYIQNLKPPLRRFEFKGIWNNRQVIDDYAHHPSEIEATLSMAQLMIDSKTSILPKTAKRIVSVFQPHRFSRTRDFLEDFANSLKTSDLIILAPIYGAGEMPIKGVSSDVLAKYIKNIKPSSSIYVANDFNHLINLIHSHTRDGDLILNMGAGDINKVWENLLSLESFEQDSPIRKVA
tara:strand:- start:2623 stop:4011 length:1389 start_codon:yes stop_codon:yes gene_type:complete